MYAIINQMKIQNLQGSLIHNNRTHSNLSNVDYSKTYKNITLQKFSYKHQNDYLESKKNDIKRYNELYGTKHRMIQKGKSFTQEFVFTHSPRALTENESIEYCKLAYKFIQERFPDNEILNSTIHLDETTPHIHINISYFNQKECRFNQKELMQKKLTDIDKIREDFDEYIKPFFPTLKKQDGTIIKNHSKQTSKEIGELKKELAQYKIALDEAFKMVDSLEDILEIEKNSHLETLVQKVKDLKNENKSLQEQINSKTTNDTTFSEKSNSRPNMNDSALERYKQQYKDSQKSKDTHKTVRKNKF